VEKSYSPECRARALLQTYTDVYQSAMKNFNQ